MTKQFNLAMAAVLVLGAGALHAQLSTTTQTTQPAPGETKTTVVTKETPGSAATRTTVTTTKVGAKKKAAAKPRAHVETATERQIRELQAQMTAQQAQIDALKQLNADKDAALASAQSTAATAQSTAAAATAQAQGVSSSVQANTDAITAVKSDVTDIKANDVGLAQTISTNKQEINDKVDSPLAIHYKGVTIQPGGFVAAEAVYRSRSINSDINTPFNSTPYMSSAQAFTSEFNGSARQSRIALAVTAPMAWGKALGYYEADFLGAGTTSNDNQTNSYLLRQRVVWGQVQTNSGFSFAGGQMWSLVTEAKKGLVEAPSGVNLPLTVDAQYHVGFSFTRQYGIRVAQSFMNNKAALAMSLEQSQTVLAGVTNAPTNFFFGSAGNTGGLYNSTGNGVAAQNYSNNVAPDVVVKFAADPGYGHYEVGGIARFFRDRTYPQTTGFTTAVSTVTTNDPGTNHTTLGGGFFANARFPVTHFLDLGIHVMQGAGVGRYGTSNLGDVTVRPNGLLEPLRSSQGLLAIETHPTKKLDVFGYAGGEYLQRTFYTAFTAAAPTTPVYVGYAPPTGQNDTGCNKELPPTAANGYSPAAGTCTGATRAVLEGSAGFIYRLFTSPTKGRVQYEATYSYLTKEAWTGVNTAEPTGYGAPKATNNMVFTSFRYYLP